MRIRNVRKYDLYLPYAGTKRGALVKTGKVSMRLPTQRFHDELLQRDWRMGKIEVLLDAADKAILGPSIEELHSEDVQVAADAIVENVAQATPEEDTPAEEPTPEPEAKAEPKEEVIKPEQVKRTRGRRMRRRGDHLRKPKSPPPALARTAGSIRLFTLAKEIGVTSRSVMAEMNRRGITAKSASMNVDEDTATLIREHFKPPAPAAVLERVGMPETGSAHEVPSGAPGMPSISAPSNSNVPSLEDLQRANAQIHLGQPKFGGSGERSGKPDELKSPLGSPLDGGA